MLYKLWQRCLQCRSKKCYLVYYGVRSFFSNFPTTRGLLRLIVMTRFFLLHMESLNVEGRLFVFLSSCFLTTPVSPPLYTTTWCIFFILIFGNNNSFGRLPIVNDDYGRVYPSKLSLFYLLRRDISGTTFLTSWTPVYVVKEKKVNFQYWNLSLIITPTFHRTQSRTSFLQAV